MSLSAYKGEIGWLEKYAGVASQQSVLGFDQTPEWFESYMSYIVSESENTMMVGVVDGSSNKPLLLMPMSFDLSRYLSVKHLSALSNYYTALFQPLMVGEGKMKGEVLSFFVSMLNGDVLAWDEIVLEPMGQESLFYKALCHSLDESRSLYIVNECFMNWYLDVGEQNYETYESLLPSKLRNTFQRKQRKLARELGYTIRIIQDENDLNDFILDYESVYEKSWKSEESHPQFIRAIIKSFAQKGWLRLGLMYIDGEPVAAQLWFVKDHVASIYKLSYDSEYAKYSVGSILMAALMRQVIDIDGVKLVDFLTGDDAYKKDWMSHQQARYRIRIYNKHSWRGQILALWNMKVKPMLGKS